MKAILVYEASLLHPLENFVFQTLVDPWKLQAIFHVNGITRAVD